MNQRDTSSFIAKWSRSGASERANKDSFLIELCDVLEVPHPDAAAGDRLRDLYVFERDALLPHEDGTVSVGKIDLYKHGCFILEAKQGSEAGAKKIGTAKRETPAWNIAMRDAFGQAIGYASTLDDPPPFLITCDIGYCFDLYATFDGSHGYRPFPNAQQHRIFLRDLEKHREVLRQLFIDPRALDPSRAARKVTREVAAHLAELARQLDPDGSRSEVVAKFLMRCIFTMFAEDVGLLEARSFTDAIEQYWIPSPRSFPGGIESLWRAMNEGSAWVRGQVLKFNGGLFAGANAIPLDEAQLRILLEAAKCSWAEVEPAIFGTLIERALDPKERHALGAHYTPRAYVERLVRPTIEDPLRDDWNLVQAEARQLVEAGKEEPARKVVRDFHRKLCATRILDPACGSGNFLYVTLDLMKRIESEVLGLLDALGEKQTALDLHHVITVSPSQFLGIEKKRWAKEIAELVLWIGYLQWHFRTRGKVAPPEPVLQDYGNIECGDAVLSWERDECVRDECGRPITQWDGESYKPSPITGELIPDEEVREEVRRYVNPGAAEWPVADFIVGNPPYIGNKRMRQALGDGYVEALRAVHSEVPETVDLVMYWWDHAARLVREGKVRRFGFVTTNSITQVFNRKVVAEHLEHGSLVFAIPDHPWVDAADGAAVRIAMTVFQACLGIGQLATVVSEGEGDGEQVAVMLSIHTGRVQADLTTGAAVANAAPLRANSRLCWQGCKLVGEGFQITPEQRTAFLLRDPDAVARTPSYWAGSDVTRTRTPRFVVDLFGLTEEQARRLHPGLMQRLIDHVLPERAQNRDPGFREKWWLFGRPRPDLRAANEGLRRYIVTSEVAKHRVFTFLSWPDDLIDGSVAAVASGDAYVLGVLSSRVHVAWALATGGTLEDRPRYQNGPCFDPFPFPVSIEKKTSRIRDFGEGLNAHRKRQQAAHSDLTITGMYNVLEKLRSGEPLSVKERVIHEQGLVSILKQLHDALDLAVFDAYGWPHDLTDEQILDRLVALNAERADEERRGIVRWLRPDFQNPTGVAAATQVALPGSEAAEPSGVAAAGGASGWSKKLPERIAAVRDLVSHSASSWSLEQVASSFKGAKRREVAVILDSLASLGLIVVFGADDTRRWCAVKRAAA